MKNKMTDLRNHLFVALEQLADPDSKVDLERIKATAEIGKVLVETAKVEVMFIRQVDPQAVKSSAFLEHDGRPAIGGK